MPFTPRSLKISIFSVILSAGKGRIGILGPATTGSFGLGGRGMIGTFGKGCFGPITIGPVGLGGRGMIGTFGKGCFGPITVGPVGLGGRGLIGTMGKGCFGPITIGPVGLGGRGLIGTMGKGCFGPITIGRVGLGKLGPTLGPVGLLGRCPIGTNGNGLFGFFIIGTFVTGVLVLPKDVAPFSALPFRGGLVTAFVNPPYFLPVGRGLVCCVRLRLPLDCIALDGRERLYLAPAAEERVEVERADFELPRDELLETDGAREKPLFPPRCGLASVTDAPTAIAADIKRINV